MDRMQRAQEYIDKHFDRFTADLCEACAIPSVSTQRIGLEEMAGWVCGRLEKLGARTSLLTAPGAVAPSVLGAIKGNGPATLMIYDHYDVQPAEPLDLWESAPFEPTRRQQKIFARGVADNKGDLVARFSAIEALLHTGELPCNILFLIEGEEEAGSVSFPAIVEAHRHQLRADGCLWEGAGIDHHGRPLAVFGCKGLLYLELSCSALSEDQHSSIAPIAPSAAWTLVHALSSLRSHEHRILIDGFYEHCENPTEQEMELVAALDFDEEAERRRLGIERFVSGETGVALRQRLLYEPTCNIAGLNSGYLPAGGQKTVLPAGALAKLDFRLVPNQKPQDIVNKVRSHLDEAGFGEIRVEVLSAEHPSRSPIDSEIGKCVLDACKQFFADRAAIYPLMQATGPMHPIAQGLGIPVCSPPGVCRPDSNIHAPNENVQIEDFLRTISFSSRLIEAFGANRLHGQVVPSS